MLETVQHKELNPAKSANTQGHRSVQTSENYIQYILAEPGDTYDALAVELDLMGWQLYRYNDIDRKNGTYPRRPERSSTCSPTCRGQALWLEMLPKRALGSSAPKWRARQVPRPQESFNT